MMTRTLIYLVFLSVAAVLLAALLYHGRMAAANAQSTAIPAKRQLVGRLGLTDLALWTEARYTRHPSQADIFTPFQDAPAAADHFPAGSIVAAQAVKPATTIRVIKKVGR